MGVYDYFVDANVYTSKSTYEGSIQVTTDKCRFLGGLIFNQSASTIYFQVFDTKTIPSDGYTGVLSVTVPAGQSISLDFTMFHGIFLHNGFYFCNSSTQPQKTLNGNNLNVTLFYA